jgi:hypothetical protein
MVETDVEKYLFNKARANGWLAWKFTSPGTTGVPDRVLVGPHGRVVWIEVKQPTGRLSARQRVRLGELDALGHDTRVVWSKPDVDALAVSLAWC